MFRKVDMGDLFGLLRRRPQIVAGMFAYESALATSGRMDLHLKSLAELKAAALVNCEFCLDIGSAMAKLAGITDAQLSALPNFRESELFNADEKLVLEFAEVVTKTPALVPDELRSKLFGRFTAAGVTELAAAVAWENNRGRFNQALGVHAAGFSQGSVCAVPEQPDS